MALLPGRPAEDLSVRRQFAVLLMVGLSFGLAASARAFDLEGTWYVLSHFQDSETNQPDAWRWDDRLWRFTHKGDRLEWTEWAIVSFESEAGRFEALSGNRAARVVAAWEPNESQLADIRDGLAVTSRGSKTKTLRAGADGASWSSGAGAAADSASIITYTETWSVAGLPALPVFQRDDTMGSAQTETMQGRTRWTTETVSADGNELSGRFERDGTRIGRFRLIRSADPSKAGEQDLEERQRKALRQQAVESGLVKPEEVQALIATQVKLTPDAQSDDRVASRAAIRKNVEDAIRAQGEDPRVHAGAVDSIARKIERLLFDEGKSLDAVQQQIASGRLTP